jgi:membrane protease subunit (stomatin/prohibitin family)
MPLFKKTVSWERNPQTSSELVWRIPNAKYPKIGNVSEVVVREFEKAVFYKGGSMINIHASGSHKIPKGTNEVVLVDISPRQELFGIPRNHGPITKDGFQVGVSGAITLRVNGDIEQNVAQFLERVVAANKTFTREQLVDWLRDGPLVSVLRDISKDLTCQEFVFIDRAELVNHQVRPRLYNELYRYGLDLLSLDITSFSEPQKLLKTE